MTLKVFLAGATGAIGTALIPQLLAAGYTVFGGTRRPERAMPLEQAGVTPIVVDVYNAAALTSALVRIAPYAVIHQLTDLPANLEPARMSEAIAANARLRDEGTRNLVEAAVLAGCTQMIAQSIAWAYRPGSLPYDETHPLDTEAGGLRGISVGGVIALEQHVLAAQSLTGTVLRYGQIYGAGTGTEVPTGPSPLHVEAAANAALLALQQVKAGIYNIAQDRAEVSSGKARRELGWSPEFRSIPKQVSN
jgi:nucleoside-diphosphate-sugar epimerase